MSMKRVTITVPEDIARRLEEVGNVSAYFTATARAQDRKLRTEAMLRRAEGTDVDPERRARVRASIRRQMAEHDARRADARLAEAQRAKQAAEARLASLEDSERPVA